jgi:predicted RNA-binding Zn-ribbon protein involved in translation (DUF1610 family)
MTTTMFLCPQCGMEYLRKSSSPAVANSNAYVYYCPGDVCRYKIMKGDSNVRTSETSN